MSPRRHHFPEVVVPRKAIDCMGQIRIVLAAYKLMDVNYCLFNTHLEPCVTVSSVIEIRVYGGKLLT